MNKDLRAIKKDSFWANIALLLLFPYSFLTGLTQMQGVHIIYPAFLLSIVIFAFIGMTCGDKMLFKKFLQLLLIVMVSLIINMVITGNTDIKNIIYGVFIFPSLGALLFFYKVRFLPSVILFFCVSLFFGLYIIENGAFIKEETDLLTNSRNYVSYFVVLYSFPYFIHCYDNDKTPSLIVPLICTIISVFAIGRGGILISLGLLAGVIFIKMSQPNKQKGLYRLLFFSLLGFILAVGVSGDFIETYFSRFIEIGMNDAGRMPAWIEYVFSLFNPINFIFGTDISSLPYTMKYLDGSLHNSYLTLHAREGIIGLVLIVLMIKGTLKLYNQKAYTLLVIIFALLIKGLTDADMGGVYSGGDIYVFYLVLVYWFFLKKKIYEGKSISTIPATVSSDTGK